jgi:hypothetical protein
MGTRFSASLPHLKRLLQLYQAEQPAYWTKLSCRSLRERGSDGTEPGSRLGCLHDDSMVLIPLYRTSIGLERLEYRELRVNSW